jgi:hypothetical protein
MTHTSLGSAALFAAITLSAGVALGQGAHVDATNSPSQNQSTNGPAGTYDMSTTHTALVPDGTKTDTTQSFDKSQSYTSGNGVLSAHTHIDTTGPTTTTIIPPTSTMGATP